MKLIKSLTGITINSTLFKKKVVKDFAAIAGANLALRPIQLLKGFIVAKYLGPADYGLLKTIELIQLLNKYGSLGFNTTAAREVGNAIGDKNTQKIQLIRNTAFSSEIVLSFILFFIGMSSSLFFESKTVSVLIILASFGLLASKLRGVMATEAVIQKKFILTSKVTFLTVTASSIIVIFTVPFLKIYAILLTNIIIGVLAIILFWRPLRFKLTFRINKNEFKRILGISIPLTIGTLSIASFKYAERILLITYLGEIALGFFSFAAMIVNQVAVIFKASIKVRIQDIYEGMGKKCYQRIHKMVIRETLLLTLLSLIIIPFFWFLIDFLIPIFLPKWIDGIFACQLFLLSLPFEVILNYPSAVLISAVVNKQRIMPLFRFGSAGILILATVILHFFKILTLEYFIVINISSIAFYNIVVLLLYNKYFIKVYVKNS